MSTDAEDAVVDAVDKRNLWRRAEDVRRNLLVIGLSAALVAGGIAWGTATAAVSQKVDRSEFDKHVAEERVRQVADSIVNAARVGALIRIELKVDSTNDRLRHLVCDGKPAYCR